MHACTHTYTLTPSHTVQTHLRSIFSHPSLKKLSCTNMCVCVYVVEGVSGDLVLSYLSLMELSGPEAFEDHLLILPTFSEMTVMDLEDMMEEDEEFASFIR